MSKLIKKILCYAFSLALLGSSRAFAERPHEDFAPKGTVPSVSTEIDRSLYAVVSDYDNVSYPYEKVRVGLCYGDRAPSEAEFINPGGEGFIIGQLNSNGTFEEKSATAANHILVKIDSPGGFWRLEADASDEKALTEAAGTFSSKAQADKKINELGINARAYFDGSGRLELLNAESEELIYESPEGISRLAFAPRGAEPQTAFMENRYRGYFNCSMHDSGHLNVINHVGLEDYVKGVIPYEMSYSWPLEALKAQAVCARTYAVYTISYGSRFSEYDCDLSADTFSQVYRGTLEANEFSDKAVDDTEGELVRYKGELCEIYYSSSNGGASEDGSNVFGTDAIYLSGKTDPFEKALDYPLKSWKKTLDPGELQWLLNEKGYCIAYPEELRPSYSDTGNVIAMDFYDNEGNCLEIQGRSCYTALGLNSCRFQISRDGEDFVFTGSGWGHNCGMSQWGARAMASVYGYSYEDIIRFYFSGAYTA